MGLRFPNDLAAWQRWQQRQHPLRSLRAILKPSQPATGVWHRTGTEPDLLVVLDSTSPSNIAALAQPLAHLPLDRIAVLAPLDITGQLPKASWTATAADLRSDLRSIRSVLLAADYLPLGASVVANMQHNTRLLYVQHGLLTPVAPPLPRNCTVTNDRLLRTCGVDSNWGRQDSGSD